MNRVWAAISSVQPAPSTTIVGALAALALVLVIWDPAWRRTRHLVTIAHEGTHGVAALATGRRLAGIRLHSDTSGLTVSRGRPGGAGMAVTALAGYPGPALAGLGAAYLLHLGRAVLVLWAVLALLAALLIQVRNWFGLWSVAVAGAGVFAVSWFGSAALQTAFAYAGTWFLLLAAPRPVVELQRLRRRTGARDTDVDILARITGVPAPLWVFALFAITMATLLIGARWLIGWHESIRW